MNKEKKNMSGVVRRRRPTQKLPSQPNLQFLIIFRGMEFCKYCKNTLHLARKISHKYYKYSCFRELFCKNFGQDGTVLRSDCMTVQAKN